MKDFLEYIVKNLVDRPEAVHIKEIEGTNTLILELQVAQPDIGKIIGKEGKTIKAIRSLLVSVASRNNLKVSLEIIEDKR
ncbi:KH domain-containing protein [Chlamydiifrater phoenicopteri]|uniref:KH domain-containing protein n=1 Tax=Chlamydiifrater phoenicopteri TaxID=2681469 RepID=UPI001BCC9BE9|nr:KH domain-containing protein [Chlamydiifrater phoenicopteri]